MMPQICKCCGCTQHMLSLLAPVQLHTPHSHRQQFLALRLTKWSRDARRGYHTTHPGRMQKRHKHTNTSQTARPTTPAERLRLLPSLSPAPTTDGGEVWEGRRGRDTARTLAARPEVQEQYSPSRTQLQLHRASEWRWLASKVGPRKASLPGMALSRR